MSFFASNRSSNLAATALLVATAFLMHCPKIMAQQAETPPPQPKANDQPRWANRGRWNLGVQLGYGVENAIPRNISHVNMVILQPQLGLIVKDFARGPVRRFEIINEGVIGNAVHPGGHMLGTTLFFRFDGKPHGNVIPFFDAGASAMHTTLSTRAPEISGTTQFMPEGGLGIQYYFRPQRAFVIEYRYFHMSNAGLQQPNAGFNGSMITLGFRWLRR